MCLSKPMVVLAHLARPLQKCCLNLSHVSRGGPSPRFTQWAVIKHGLSRSRNVIGLSCLAEVLRQ